MGKKLAEALANTEVSLLAAMRALERERAARARLEKVCEELARGGGAVAEDEDELRREAALDPIRDMRWRRGAATVPLDPPHTDPTRGERAWGCGAIPIEPQ